MPEADKRFYDSDDVAQIMGCSKSHAYTLIRKLNKELEEKGYLFVNGKINSKYFNERVYG